MSAVAGSDLPRIAKFPSDNLPILQSLLHSDSSIGTFQTESWSVKIQVNSKRINIESTLFYRHSDPLLYVRSLTDVRKT